MSYIKKVSVRIDVKLKDDFTRTLDEIGLDPTNAMRSFAFQLARKKALPFELEPQEYELSGKTTVTSFKAPDAIIDEGNLVLQQLGLNYSSAIKLLALQSIAEGAIPFRAGA